MKLTAAEAQICGKRLCGANFRHKETQKPTSATGCHDAQRIEAVSFCRPRQKIQAESLTAPKGLVRPSLNGDE
jgi:hypothetical protein